MAFKPLHVYGLCAFFFFLLSNSIQYLFRKLCLVPPAHRREVEVGFLALQDIFKTSIVNTDIN
jgi:hypothetical protein